MRLTTAQIVTLAAKHLNNGAAMASSALSCFEDAMRLFGEGRNDLVEQWAERSLAYSVGIFHADYQTVKGRHVCSCRQDPDSGWSSLEDCGASCSHGNQAKMQAWEEAEAAKAAKDRFESERLLADYLSENGEEINRQKW